MIPVKQLIKTAFITAPIMGLMLITPLYILTNGINDFNFFVLWGGISFAITIAWLIHISFLVFNQQSWVKTWKRVVITSLIMYGISFIIFYVLEPHLKIDRTKIEIIRLINITAINAFIYILTDLILTKENKNKYALENSNLKLTNLEAEFKLLKDQINPHFLFNALSTAKALIKKQPQLAEDYIVGLSEFLRASINNNKKTVSLKEELELCNQFISLNQIRFGVAIKFTNNLVIDLERFSVPYFSILSLIENAIKHNSFTIEKPLYISVKSIENNLEVKNNKQNKFVMDDSPKTGLKNINERYKLLNAQEIIIENTNDYFCVLIPLLKK